MMRRVVAAFIVVSFNLVSYASAAPSDDESTRKAKQLFKAGETDFTLGRFQSALDNYSKAYEAKPLPAFLFNIGQCHMELENYERAIFFYEQYLRGDVDAKKRALVNKRLELARARQAEVQAQAERQRKEDEAREQAELAARAQEQARLAAEAQSAADAQRLELYRQVDAPQNKPIYKKWWFWAAAAGVAAIAVTTVVITSKTNTELPQGDLDTIDARGGQ